MNPIPILFIDHATAMGGAENSLKLLLEHLDSKHWELHLACPDGALSEAVGGLNVPVHKLPLPPLRRSPRAPVNWGYGIRTLARIAREIKARAIISNTIRSTVFAGPAAKLSQTGFVWTMRDFWLGESEPQRLWFDKLGKQALCRMANAVIANSTATAQHLPCQSKTTVIHNGIAADHFKPSLNRQDSRAPFKLPDDAFVIGVVGRLRPWKGQDRFLRVLKYVVDAHPSAFGIIVGGTPFGPNSPYTAQLQQIVRENNLQDRVIFTGQLDDIRPALAAMDVFVHPGEPEPFGLVNIEAMAMAKPVVAFAHGALPEIVIDGETGMLVPPVDERAMAQAISTLLRDPLQRSVMGAAGRRRVEDAFTIERTARAFDEVLTAVCN
ncbi:MAG: glycosyltransferase family 1 protein [Anaerolineales bacterium]|nr:MAG: glycosyltransferase family 1 protein [Anaerolineales bacterium]